MNYKVGDTVTVMSTGPKKKTTPPYWVKEMNQCLGKQITIKHLSVDGQWYSDGNYYFREEWFEDYHPADTLNERICNKIRQLDTKWKERTNQCA